MNVLEKIKIEGFVQNFEVNVKKKDGTTFWIVVSTRPVIFEGKPVFLSGMYDITHRKEAEEKLRMTLGNLEKTQEQLIQSEKMASLGQLVAGIAHEINNPINFIYTSLPSVKEIINNLMEQLENFNKIEFNDLPDVEHVINRFEQVRATADYMESKKDIDDLLEIMNEGTQRIVQIVKVMRQSSRGEEIETEVVDINKSIDSSLNLFRGQYKGKVEIIKEYCSDSLIEFNPGQLNQVLMNILANSIHAIESKGEIRIRTFRKSNDFYISISDTGKGIPEENISKIFDPFYTTKDVGRGLGLGLSICYQIIKKYGGQIRVKSIFGNGTEFLIALPVKRG